MQILKYLMIQRPLLVSTGHSFILHSKPTIQKNQTEQDSSFTQQKHLITAGLSA